MGHNTETTTGAQGITRELALSLCEEIHLENRRKWFSIWKLQCIACYNLAKGDIGKLCISGKQGCPQVNSRYKRREETSRGG